MKEKFEYNSLMSILPQAFTILNRGETFIRIDDTKKKITYKISYSDLLNCILSDLNNVRRDNR